MKRWSPVLTTLLVLAFSLPGLGSRHLWQDEVETAERARTILESGYPRVIDESGTPSLNVGGMELEDGAAHRYTPWLQYYAAAAGLWGAETLGASRDAGVRLPFALSHAATSGLVSWSLLAFGGASVWVANAVGLALGSQSIRLLHNRTSRYHALLDLLVATGILGLAAYRNDRRWGLPLVSIPILLLPHVHTLAGSLLSLLLGFFCLMLVVTKAGDEALSSRLVTFALWVALPGLVSLVGLLLLTRPGAREWDWWRPPNLRSLRDLPGLTYALVFWLLGVLWTGRRAPRSLALWSAGGLGLAIAVLSWLERFPFSQSRYYFALVLIGLLWPVIYGLDWAAAAPRRWLYRALLLFCLLPELFAWLLPTTRIGNPEKHWFYPFQGIRVVARDASSGFASREQPLEQAIRMVREQAAPDDPVLFDYVPQFANWYLPGHPIALMPDPHFRGGFNADHPIWSRPLVMPEWHIWYPSYGSGVWRCLDQCDYQALHYQEKTGRYQLRSRHLDRSVAMCTIRAWKTHHWNNAPFMNLLPSALRPAGATSGRLVLARPCT